MSVDHRTKTRPVLQRLLYPLALLSVLVFGVPSGAAENDTLDMHVGVDLFSRYVWRGSDIGDSPSIQPALSMAGYGFELGAWSAYPFSSESSDDDEIDFWLSYARELNNGVSVTLIVTDYYYPNSGIGFSKADAHTLETGLSVTGVKGFPITVSGYVNVSNDDGHNTYFELDYPASVDDIDLRFFFGFAGGSEKNPAYYGTEGINVINMGISATRDMEITERFTLPLTGSMIYNPRAEVAYVVVGVSF
jgi:uncharacterized protein (TIGR02001 family)